MKHADTSWSRYTFAAKHETSGDLRQYPGHGSVKFEWGTVFDASPLDPGFMLQGSDIHPALMSHDGRYFTPVNIPHNGGVLAGAFSPHHGPTAALLLGRTWLTTDALPCVSQPNDGVWITRDRGNSWHLAFRIPVDQPECWQRPQGRTLLLFDPSPTRPHRLYLASWTRGLQAIDIRTGYTQTLAFPGQNIRSLSGVSLPNGDTQLFVIVADPPQTRNPEPIPDDDFPLPGWTYWRIGELAPDGKLYRVMLGHNALHTELLCPDTTDLTDIEADPHDPDRVFFIAGRSGPKQSTNAGGSALYRLQLGKPSTPQKLVDTSSLSLGSLAAVHADPHVPGRLILRGNGRLANITRFSQDHGETWSNPFPVVDDACPDFMIDGQASANDYHGTTHNSVLFPPTKPGEPYPITLCLGKTFFQTADFGQTFTHLPLCGLPVKGSWHLAAAGPHLAVARWEYGVQFSHDRGQTWRVTTHDSDPTLDQLRKEQEDQIGYHWGNKGFWSIAFQANNPKRCVGVFGRFPSLVVSDDAGRTWTETHRAGFPRALIYWHPQDPNTVYAGQLRSTDAGNTWHPLDHAVVAVNAADGKTVLGIDQDDFLQINRPITLYLSRDAGDTWQPLTELPDSPALRGADSVFTYWDSTGEDLDALTSPLLRQSFALDPAPPPEAPTPEAVGDPDQPPRLAYATLGGIRLFDAGRWSQHPIPRTPTFPGDAAFSWMRDVMFSPTNPSTLYATTTVHSRADWIHGRPAPPQTPRALDYTQSLWRSLDRGHTWHCLNHLPGLPPNTPVLTAAASADGHFYADGYTGFHALRQHG